MAILRSDLVTLTLRNSGLKAASSSCTKTRCNDLLEHTEHLLDVLIKGYCAPFKATRFKFCAQPWYSFNYRERRPSQKRATVSPESWLILLDAVLLAWGYAIQKKRLGAVQATNISLELLFDSFAVSKSYLHRTCA
jgi:hypothetical protein